MRKSLIWFQIEINFRNECRRLIKAAPLKVEKMERAKRKREHKKETKCRRWEKGINRQNKKARRAINLNSLLVTSVLQERKNYSLAEIDFHGKKLQKLVGRSQIDEITAGWIEKKV